MSDLLQAQLWPQMRCLLMSKSGAGPRRRRQALCTENGVWETGSDCADSHIPHVNRAEEMRRKVSRLWNPDNLGSCRSARQSGLSFLKCTSSFLFHLLRTSYLCRSLRGQEKWFLFLGDGNTQMFDCMMTESEPDLNSLQILHPIHGALAEISAL